jgi:L-ascorbate metabolism protein UlaG (beta-lactamase superfamily)
MGERWYKKGGALLEEIKNSPSESRGGEADIWFLGQHGFVLNLEGMVIYIDVILNDILAEDGSSRRRYLPPFSPGVSQRVDFFLCTHNHLDHLSLDTLVPLAKANPLAQFVVPLPHREILTGAGIAGERVLGAGTGEALGLSGDLRLYSVAAAHREYIQAEPEREEDGNFPSLGYVIKGGGLSVYHAGDTWVTPSLVNSLRTLGPLDIAILPINGTDWERTSQGYIGNMSALDAVKLARAVPADLVIPAHYEMMPSNSENPAHFVDYLYGICPEKKFHIFALGERFRYVKT